jgi:hypothetical protein
MFISKLGYTHERFEARIHPKKYRRCQLLDERTKPATNHVRLLRDLPMYSKFHNTELSVGVSYADACEGMANQVFPHSLFKLAD